MSVAANRAPFKVALIGAGDRGSIYARFIRKNPGRFILTAVAEPDPRKARDIAVRFGLPTNAVFADWSALLDAQLEGRLEADAVIVATMDRQHYEPASRAIAQGLHALLEKPVATTPEETARLAAQARAAGLTLTVCHVLRYTRLFRAVKKLVDDGAVGLPVSILHAENVAWYHMAHSYVRGNWGSSVESSPMILAKCSHDLDLIAWFAGSRPEALSSVGGSIAFRPENAPAGAPERCSLGCPAAKECPYEAEACYLRGRPIKAALAANGAPLTALAARALMPVWKEWPTSTITRDLSAEGIRRALAEGPFGRCVYRCGGDQPDHQDTVISFASGLSATLRLHGMSSKEGRTIRIDGTEGTLRATFGGRSEIELWPHGAIRPRRYRFPSSPLGHSEGDEGVMMEFHARLSEAAEATREGLARGDAGPPSDSWLADSGLTSHLMAFAAHRSRLSGASVPWSSWDRLLQDSGLGS